MIKRHLIIFSISFTDTKNSVGLVGLIEEVSHNAIAVYWNPLESSAKVSETTEEHSKRFIFISIYAYFLFYYFLLQLTFLCNVLKQLVK